MTTTEIAYTPTYDPPAWVTVEDRAGLEALPEGTVYMDVEGDVILKHRDGQFYLAPGGEWPWGIALLEEFLPGLVLNPEIL